MISKRSVDRIGFVVVIVFAMLLIVPWVRGLLWLAEHGAFNY